MNLRGINAITRFVLELCALAVLSWWGVDVGRSWLGSLVLGIAFPVLAAMTWGNFVAPRAPRYLPLGGRVGIEIAFFGTPTVGLAAMGHWVLAPVFGVLAAVNTSLHHVWKQDDDARRRIAAPPGAPRRV
ncbi:MAG: YrdB family protein [Streptomycetaceae bacterium]|nr:YrdB family protein [Streptomycetaceae bacterium]